MVYQGLPNQNTFGYDFPPQGVGVGSSCTQTTKGMFLFLFKNVIENRIPVLWVRCLLLHEQNALSTNLLLGIYLGSKNYWLCVLHRSSFLNLLLVLNIFVASGIKRGSPVKNNITLCHDNPTSISYRKQSNNQCRKSHELSLRLKDFSKHHSYILQIIVLKTM